MKFIKNNPLRPLSYLSKSTDTELIEISLGNWDKLCKKLLNSKSISIINGGLFQNTIRFFFHNEISLDAIYHYVNIIEKYINEMDGIVFLLNTP
jgi:hypothetical protein